MKLHSIQFLRSIAALLVVYVHAIDLQMQFSVSKQQNFFYLQNFGAIGVDIFFAISGFIITFVANKYTGTKSGFNFLVKRFIRINPIYYVGSALLALSMLTYAWIRGSQIFWPQLLSSLADTLLIVPVTGDTNQYNPILLIGWTLSFEWFFYLVFILLIIFRSTNKPLHLVLLITTLVILGKIAAPSDYRLIFITNPVQLEFLLGVITCWVYLNFHVNNRIAALLVISGIVGFIYSIFWGYGEISEAGHTLSGQLSMQRFLLWGVPSGLLTAGCILLEKNGTLNWIWNNKLSRITGDASYSIYLVHLTVFYICSILYSKIGFPFNPDLSIFMHVGIATLIGIIFYKLVESPLLNYLQYKHLQRSAPTYLSGNLA
ncbi:acyltransferase [Chitinophaga agrisoli]|uniref:Acyltransferase n=1 Tax=Chitinophaga agrisoli TaxID=2607653 RepID=A0A5B2VNJ5_9BACT|nr:acyltransferase [Chitinophaga agrisoli]KAA2239882.1 acyltransferase [Chitinophaga agrisoli]